jgi:hypothetical protein
VETPPSSLTISFLPAGSENTASSRLRVYSIHRELTRRNIRSAIGYVPQADVIVVQKRLTASILSLVHAVKRLHSGIVIYDCDDLGEALEYWAPRDLLQEILPLADVVTTNSRPYCEALRRYGASNVELLPDAVDYYLAAPICTPGSGAPELRILWFGNARNVRLWTKYADSLCRLPGYRLIVCSSERVRPIVSEYPRAEFVRWTLGGFPSVLQSCDISLLSHDGSQCDQAKSNNRMITSIAWGVPAVVSRTPEYERAATLFGVPGALFTGPEDAIAAMEALRSVEARRKYLDTAQPVVWQYHSPERIADRFCELIAKYLARAG